MKTKIQIELTPGVAERRKFSTISKVNDALEHLRYGKARYRVVLINDLTKSRSEAMSRQQEQAEAALQVVWI